MRLPLLSAALLGVFLLALSLAGAATAAPSSLRLDRALAGSGVPARGRSVVVLDRRTGRVVYAQNPGRPLRPASNEKLPVSVAALRRLGPRFRFETRVLGAGVLRGGVWRGNLVLKGSGDPTLTSRDLAALARQIRSLGITRVQGRVIGDESRFDRLRVARGWKRSYSRYCEPLSALVVDGARINGRVSSRPALTAAILFRRQLQAHGVRVAGGRAVGRAPGSARLLARVQSEPLAEIVERMNRDSDNFVAEMLLKELGSRRGLPGTTGQGAQVVIRVLRELGVPVKGVRIADGSGLSRHNRLTAASLGRLLVAARRTPGLAAPFVGSLAVAGRSGTLAYRLRGTPAQGRMVGKTGSTSLASSLSGYVAGRYAFSILMNGQPVPHWSARAGQDRFVSVLAAEAN